MKNIGTFKRLHSTRLAAWTIIASVALNLLAVITPLAILMIFERVVPHQSLGTLQAICLVLLVGAILELFLRRARASLLIFAAGRNASKNQGVFLSHILKSDPVALRQDDPAVHLERHSAVEQLREQDAGESRTLIIDLPFCLFFIALIGLIGGWLILVPCTILVAVVVFAWVAKHAQRNIFKERRETDRRRYAFLSEVFSHIGDVKANTMEQQMARRFEMLQGKTATASLYLIRFSGASQGFGAAIGQISVAGMGLFGAFLVMQETVGLAELAACMLLNGRVVQPVTKLLTIWVQEEASAAARAKLQEISEVPSHFRDGANISMRGAIDCSDARLAFPNSKEAATDAFTFRVAAGETMLVDADQSQLVLRFFAAFQGHSVLAQGRIYIDGRLPSDWIPKRGREGILFLEEAPAIFSGTLMDNLSGFGNGEQIDNARAIASQLGLDGRVRRLPDGYDTPLNVGGYFERNAVNRQLIALTRAIAMQPKVLMMQEPSAVLDVEERNALQKCLRSLDGSTTILVASPDPRLRDLADKTLTLESAELRELRQWNVDTENEGAVSTNLRGAA